MIQLGELAIGEKAKVLGYHACDVTYRRKLLIMGFTPGTVITVMNIAPLGDPIAVSLRGLFVSLRKSEARMLKLEKLS